MPARDHGAEVGAQLDHLTSKSYQEYGYQAGEKIDRIRGEINESLRTQDGKTPEDHFRELYGATSSLVGHTYDYAWSWVPFTKQKAHQAKEGVKNGKENLKQMGQDGKEYMAHTSASDMKKDAQNKGQDMKDRAMNQELGDDNVTLGGLINESRSLVGQVLNTMVYYVRVAEQTAEDTVKDPSGTASDMAEQSKDSLDQGADQMKANTKARGNSLFSRARNLTAFVMEKSSDIITLGQEKAGQAGDQIGASAEKMQDSVEGAKNQAGVDMQAGGGNSSVGTGSGPHFSVSMQL